MIEAICHTKLDGFNYCRWPRLFVAMPNIGDYVRDENGKILKVVSITHCSSTTNTYTIEEKPYLRIELNY